MAAVDLYLPLAYTPESNLAPPEPSSDPEQQPDLKECSVRGCHQKVPISAHTKMCEGCRGRHRVYATTKRMKRKLEKAKLQNIVGNFVNQSGMKAGAELGEEDATPGVSAGQDQYNVQVIMNIKLAASLSDKGLKGTVVVSEINVGIPSGAFEYAPGHWDNSQVDLIVFGKTNLLNFNVTGLGCLD